MKNYQIDFTANTITITQKFAKAAGQIGTEEFQIMMELRRLNMAIITKPPVKKKSSNLTYERMKRYIALLEDSEKYQKEFEAVYVESLSMNAPYAYVRKWFKTTFPSYGKQPERNAEMKIVNVPANYDVEAAD